jgi:hypothetical protein
MGLAVLSPVFQVGMSRGWDRLNASLSDAPAALEIALGILVLAAGVAYVAYAVHAMSRYMKHRPDGVVFEVDASGLSRCCESLFKIRHQHWTFNDIRGVKIRRPISIIPNYPVVQMIIETRRGVSPGARFTGATDVIVGERFIRRLEEFRIRAKAVV